MAFEGWGAQSLTDVAFGGTFDPPHEGHRLLAYRILEALPRVRLWIFPAKAPAGAHGQHKVPGASFAQRLAMCSLTFARDRGAGSEKASRITIDPLEGQLPEPNFTLSTLEALGKRQPEARWGFLMGRDQIANFAAWHQPSQIAKTATLIVADRDQDDELDPLVQQLGQKLGLIPDRQGATEWKWKGLSTGLYWLTGCVSPAASRNIRTDPAAALKSGWISPEVARYINDQGLYRQ